MTNIKMIVFDLDDTLLRRDKTVGDYTISVLHKCREAGIKIVIATGRGHPEVVAPVELFDGIIANNGANIFDGATETRRCIPCGQARPLLLACHRRGMRLTSQFGGRHYANFDISLVWPHIVDYEIVDFAEHALDSEKICIEQITPEDAAFVEPFMNEAMYMKVARDGLGMIMHGAATKSAAIADLAGRWNMGREEIAAFGDDLNDIDMLTYVGVGVAMANALDEVKAAASQVCGDCDDDGAAKWIEARFL